MNKQWNRPLILSTIAVLALVLPEATDPSPLEDESHEERRQKELQQKELPQPTGLLCELMAHPERTRIRTARPTLGWIVNGSGPHAIQTAYQIQVASSLQALADNRGTVWNSGKVASSTSTNVPYGGAPLAPDTTYHWKVRTWNGEDRASPYSNPQTFHTGALTEDYVTEQYPLVTEEIAPTQIVQKEKGHYFIDFGKAAFGTIKMMLTTSPWDDREAEVHLGEALSGPRTVDRKPGATIRHRKMRVPLERGTSTYTVRIPPVQLNTRDQAIKMPDRIGEVMPFRYAEVINSPSPLDEGNIQQKAVHYPFNEHASHFVSSDTVLNAVWDLSKYSMKATSFTGVYVDGDRERRPYEADAYINQLGHYSVDREFTMARYSHEYLMTHPTWPTEWIMHSVLMAWADYLHTGNEESIKQYYEDLKAKTLLALAREDGLISTETGLVTEEVLRSIHFDGELRDIVDWPRGERDDYDMVPINTVVNAFHYRSLVLMSNITEVVGKAKDERTFRKRAMLVKETINEKLFDEQRGIYVDGETSDHASLHANMFPLAFGLVPEQHKQSVVDFIKSKGMATSVYGAQYLLDGLYQAGADDYALSLLTSTSERSWAHMIYDVGTTITLEAWDQKYKGNLDWNHAWGGAPANIIPRWLMGVRPLEPGFRKVLIQPRSGTLASAHLKLPTIRGAITARFENRPDSSFFLDVDVPANTTARVALPRQGSDTPTVLLDGNPVAGDIEGAFVIVDPVRPGQHTLVRQ